MILEVTKEKVLEAASKCDSAKATLRVLFPEAFKESDNDLPAPLSDIKSRFGTAYIKRNGRDFKIKLPQANTEIMVAILSACLEFLKGNDGWRLWQGKDGCLLLTYK
jgi:hypothetical protein